MHTLTVWFVGKTETGSLPLQPSRSTQRERRKNKPEKVRPGLFTRLELQLHVQVLALRATR